MSKRPSKIISLYDANNYYITTKTIFFDKRAEKFPIGDDENYTEIHPDILRLSQEPELSAKWTGSEWIYEEEINEEEEQVLSDNSFEDAMYYLREVRNLKLNETDDLILQYQLSKKNVPEEIVKYRQYLRDLPKKIKDGQIEKPILIEKNEISNIADPTTYIKFDWKEVPKTEE